MPVGSMTSSSPKDVARALHSYYANETKVQIFASRVATLATNSSETQDPQGQAAFDSLLDLTFASNPAPVKAHSVVIAARLSPAVYNLFGIWYKAQFYIYTC
jgi:hypothetical protein